MDTIVETVLVTPLVRTAFNLFDPLKSEVLPLTPLGLIGEARIWEHDERDELETFLCNMQNDSIQAEVLLTEAEAPERAMKKVYDCDWIKGAAIFTARCVCPHDNTCGYTKEFVLANSNYEFTQ